MSDKSPPEAKTKIGLDELSEDMFGLSIRAFRTLRGVIIAPKRVYKAARTPDWQAHSFTPSIRLSFSLLAVMVAIRFLWVGPDSFLAQSTYDQLLASGVYDQADARRVAEDIIETFLVVFPIGFLVMHMIMAACLFIWGKGTELAVRLRLYFVAILPNLMLTLVTLPLIGSANLASYASVTAGLVFCTFLLDFITAFRGGVGGVSRLVRGAKSALFGGVSLIVTILANSISYAIASAFVTGTL